MRSTILHAPDDPACLEALARCDKLVMAPQFALAEFDRASDQILADLGIHPDDFILWLAMRLPK